MNQTEVNRFNKFFDSHQMALKLQGEAKKTIDAYSRAIRRARDYFDCCPDMLKPEQLEGYFSDLVESHSWSTAEEKAIKTVANECGIKRNLHLFASAHLCHTSP